MQAAVAGFADPAGFEELLAGNRRLLVTAAGAKHISTIPSVRNGKKKKKKEKKNMNVSLQRRNELSTQEEPGLN